MEFTKVFVFIGCVALAIVLDGCESNSAGSQSGLPAADASTNDSSNKKGSAIAHDEDADMQTDMEKMKTALSKLSPEDAESAEKQHVCPVSGEMLGTMGPPERVDVKGKIVWICCDGCRDKLLSDPDKYLAKLHQE